MNESRKVSITLESVLDGNSQTHSYEGEWFRKELSIFIRYSEYPFEGESEAGEVRTLVRYRPNEMSIVRRGAIQSEQLFMLGHRQPGSYRSPMTSFLLETETMKLTLDATEENPEGIDELPSQLPFTIEWEYEMYVSDQMSGRFQMRLHIQEEQI